MSSQEAPPCSKVGLCSWGPSQGSFQILLSLDAQRTDLRFSFPAHSGFGDRLLSEVKKLAPKDVKIRVGTWCGLGLGGTGPLRVRSAIWCGLLSSSAQAFQAARTLQVPPDGSHFHIDPKVSQSGRPFPIPSSQKGDSSSTQMWWQGARLKAPRVVFQGNYIIDRSLTFATPL